MAKLTLYGIKACSTVKKACTWLEGHGHTFDFHDYKKQAADPQQLQRWCDEHGWQTLLNRQGTSFRKLDESRKQDLDERKAIVLMLENNSMIKRPILDLGDRTLVGFNPERYRAALET